MLLEDFEAIRYCIRTAHSVGVGVYSCELAMAGLRRIQDSLPPERTPDGHAQVWLLYRPEPWAPDSSTEREINLWVRRADVFTSRQEAIDHLDALIVRQIAWRPYHDLFPELWIGELDGKRWLMCPSPVNPPAAQL